MRATKSSKDARKGAKGGGIENHSGGSQRSGGAFDITHMKKILIENLKKEMHRNSIFERNHHNHGNTHQYTKAQSSSKSNRRIENSRNSVSLR